MHLSKALYLHGNLTYTHRPSFLGLRQSFLLFKDNLSLWSWPLPKLFQPFPLWWHFALGLKTCSSSSNLGTPSLTSHLPLRVHPLLFTSVHLNYSRNHLLISTHSSSHYNLFFFFSLSWSLLELLTLRHTKTSKWPYSLCPLQAVLPGTFFALDWFLHVCFLCVLQVPSPPFSPVSKSSAALPLNGDVLWSSCLELLLFSSYLFSLGHYTCSVLSVSTYANHSQVSLQLSLIPSAATWMPSSHPRCNVLN